MPRNIKTIMHETLRLCYAFTVITTWITEIQCIVGSKLAEVHVTTVDKRAQTRYVLH